MVDEHITVDRIRMIEISLMTLVQRHVREISVIRVLLHENNVSRTDSLNDRLRNRRFPRARSAANSDYHKCILTTEIRRHRVWEGLFHFLCVSVPPWFNRSWK